MGELASLRATAATALVLRALLAAEGELYGGQLVELTGLASGAVHPILSRLVDRGWLQDRWEDVDQHEVGRPRRHFYTLHPDAVAPAQKLVEQKATMLQALDKTSITWSWEK